MGAELLFTIGVIGLGILINGHGEHRRIYLLAVGGRGCRRRADADYLSHAYNSNRPLHVRLFTRNGHDWTQRVPLVVEAALRHRNSSFVIDGEAVPLGVDGRSDFNGLHSRKHDVRSSSTPSTCW